MGLLHLCPERLQREMWNFRSIITHGLERQRICRAKLSCLYNSSFCVMLCYKWLPVQLRWQVFSKKALGKPFQWQNRSCWMLFVSQAGINTQAAAGCTTEPRCLKGLGIAVPAWLWCLIWTNWWYCNWLWFLNKHFRHAVLQCVTHRPENQKAFHCLGFYHYVSQGKQSRLLDMCFRIFFFFVFFFVLFLCTKAKMEGERARLAWIHDMILNMAF